MLNGDAQLLGQAVANLLDNAIKYTSPGGQVDFLLRASDEQGATFEPPVDPACSIPPTKDGQWLAFVIRDTGRGISPQDLPHVFERFYRADRSRSGSGGLGLGLAIAKETVEGHSGTIGVRSEPGQGSCFCILLPVEQG
jgi:signal transduction histidine kinase